MQSTSARKMPVLLAILFAGTLNAQLHASIDSLITGWENTQSPGISIAVVKQGRTIYMRSLGMANIKSGQANHSTTTFWIASVSKQFTAAAIYLLASQNKLQVHRSIRYYVTGLPDFFEAITIDHLVHHTSGMRDGFVLTALSKKPPGEYTNQNVLERLRASTGLNNPVGAKFEYNNSGYVLLAMVIEKVGGKPYPEYMRENIFRPLGMNETYVSPTFPLNERQAQGYQQEDGKFGAYHFPGNTYGSTGVITTIADMARWSRFLQDPKTVPGLKSIVAPLLQTGRLSNGKPVAYAGGLEKFIYRATQVYEHFGADEGFKAEVLYFPATQVSVTGLTNNSSYYGLQELLFHISDVVHSKQRAQDFHIDDSEKMQSETYYYNGEIPQLLKVQKFNSYVKIGNSPSGYATPYKLIGDTLRSLNAIPAQYILSKGMLAIFDTYYRSAARLTAMQPVSNNDNLKALAGEYFSNELQTSYKIIATEKGLQLEFVPGVVFDLFRITDSDFMFEYSGPNYLQFGKEGFEFSREGCRRMVFKKIS